LRFFAKTATDYGVRWCFWLTILVEGSIVLCLIPFLAKGSVFRK
jgi:hypothetical protein